MARLPWVDTVRLSKNAFTSGSGPGTATEFSEARNRFRKVSTFEVTLWASGDSKTKAELASIYHRSLRTASDIGDPEPIGNSGIAWQPRLQGSMGYAEAKKVFTSGDLQGDVNKYQTFAIQFGGGGRFWFNDHLSLAPTFMGMYGHTKNLYTANNPNTQAIAGTVDEQLVNWHADTWTIRPAGNVQYVYTWHRTILTLSSDYTYYHTESFSSSTSLLNFNGDSDTWAAKIDVDVPLKRMLWGHELRTGGYFSRTQFFDNLKSGTGTDHLYEIHPRLVLDFLGQLWKVQWIGIGGSYIWGGPITGYAIGVDVAFRF